MTAKAFSHHKVHFRFYKTAQDSPTLMLIPDLYLNAGMWDDFIRSASRKGFNLLTCDFYSRNHEAPSLNTLAAEWNELFQDLQLRKVHLAGCRTGASLAVELALLIPEKIESLTLISLPLLPQQEHYMYTEKWSAQLQQSDPALFEKQYMMECLHPLTLTKARTVLHALRSDAGKQNQFMLEAMRNSKIPEDECLADRLKKWSKPVFFLYGEADPVIPATAMMVVTACVPGSRSMIVPGASSLIPMDDPEFTAARIDNFINKSDRNRIPLPDADNEMIQSIQAMVSRVYNVHAEHHRNLVLSVMDGKTEVYWNGRLLSGQWKKRNAAELLLFLIFNHGTVKRDAIIDAFTPDLELSQARNRLRVQLSYLNSLLQEQPDESVHDLLSISRDTVTLNAEAVCDLGEFIRNIEELSWSAKPVEKRSEMFLNFLDDYHPDILNHYHGAWVEKLDTGMKNSLSQTLGQILLDLKKSGNRGEMRHLLTKGTCVEPYKGFCRSWLDVLNHSGTGSGRKFTGKLTIEG